MVSDILLRDYSIVPKKANNYSKNIDLSCCIGAKGPSNFRRSPWMHVWQVTAVEVEPLSLESF